MASFQQKTLNPLMREASDKIDKALTEADITARTDGLVAAREESEQGFAKAARKQVFKILGLGVLGGIGAGTTAFGINTATSLIALLAGTSGLAIPLAIAGAAVFVAAVAGAAVSGANLSKIKQAWKSISKRADKEVSNLVTAYPQETSKSSKLAAYLKRVFNPAASAEPAATAPAPAVNAPKPAQPALTG